MGKTKENNNQKIRGELANSIASQAWDCNECGFKNSGIATSCIKCGVKTNPSNRMRYFSRLVIIFLITFAVVFIIVFDQ